MIVWVSVIAVVGTLLGSTTAFLLQQRALRTDRAETRKYEKWRDQLAAVTALTVALADYRRAMWAREDLRLSDAPGGHEEARAETHTARSALTAPLTTLAVLAPALAPTATRAAQAAYALRNAPDHQTLTTLRTAAMNAADDLVHEAAVLLS
ncbi:protein kilB [Streptomyces sp. NPDC051018]|uniref:protein kilB n=1 Tax=Streptomyces sp. NPDC051018 TaxID=3365639 RepID=UPI0037AFF59E